MTGTAPGSIPETGTNERNGNTGVPENDLNVVAIDFGSTSSAAAMFSQLTGVTWRMDPEQADVARKGIQSILQDTWLAPLVNTYPGDRVDSAGAGTAGKPRRTRCA